MEYLDVPGAVVRTQGSSAVPAAMEWPRILSRTFAQRSPCSMRVLHSRAVRAKMHSVNESATGLVERRMADTAERMMAVARRLTAERGLSGFTIDELCADVGVSRRTFF